MPDPLYVEIMVSMPYVPEERRRQVMAAGMTLALVAAYGGQAVLLRTVSNEPNEARMQALGGGLLLAAALLFGLAVPSNKQPTARLDFPAEPENATGRWSRWAIASVIAAVGLAVAAV